MPQVLEVANDFSAEGMLFAKGEIKSFSLSFIEKYGDKLQEPKKEQPKAAKVKKEEE